MAAEMQSIRFSSSLTPRDVMAVSARLLVLHRLSLTAMASGPVLLLVGFAGDSKPVGQLGAALSWLLIAIPAFGFLVGSFNAYRPGSSALYEAVEYAFGEDGVELSHPGRDARAEWSEFRSWRKAGCCYLLDLPKQRYLIIPAAALPADSAAGFEALLESRLGAKRR